MYNDRLMVVAGPHVCVQIGSRSWSRACILTYESYVVEPPSNLLLKLSPVSSFVAQYLSPWCLATCMMMSPTGSRCLFSPFSCLLDMYEWGQTSVCQQKMLEHVGFTVVLDGMDQPTFCCLSVFMLLVVHVTLSFKLTWGDVFMCQSFWRKRIDADAIGKALHGIHQHFVGWVFLCCWLHTKLSIWMGQSTLLSDISSNVDGTKPVV